MSRIFGKEDVLAMLERAVEAKGADYVDPGSIETYGSCEYAKNGAPSCIVGHVFDYLGLDVTKLENGIVQDEVLVERFYVSPDERLDFDTYRFDPSFYRGAKLEEPEVEFTKEAVTLLGYAQAQQDVGKTWGEAVKFAKEEI